MPGDTGHQQDRRPRVPVARWAAAVRIDLDPEHQWLCWEWGCSTHPRSRTSRRRGGGSRASSGSPRPGRRRPRRSNCCPRWNDAGMTQWRKHGREPLAARRCWGQRALVEVFTERWVKAGHVQPRLRWTAKEHTVELAGRGLMGALAVNVFAAMHGTISIAVCSAPRGTPSVISGRTLPGQPRTAASR